MIRMFHCLESLLGAHLMPRAFQSLLHLVLRRGKGYCPHFTDGDTEASGDEFAQHPTAVSDST